MVVLKVPETSVRIYILWRTILEARKARVVHSETFFGDRGRFPWGILEDRFRFGIHWSGFA